MTLPGVPRLLLRAGLNYQLRHRWQALLALCGIIMGVTVVLAVDLANSAARASFELSAGQLSGAATHRILGQAGRVDETLYRRLFNTPGRPPMAPVIQTRVRVLERPGRFQLLGLDVLAEGAFREGLPSNVRGAASLGDWLADPRALQLSASAAATLGVEKGDELSVRLDGVTTPLRVFAIGSDDSLGSSHLLVVDIATAQALAGMAGFISHIDLILDEPSRVWLEGKLPESVRLVDIQGQTADVVGLSSAFELNLTAMSLLALLVGLFLIYNAMSFSIVQRRNLFGRLRSLGVRSDEIYRLVLAEALVLALIGTALGCLLGIWLGQGLTRIVAATISDLYYQVSADAMQVSVLSLAKAIVLGLVGTVFAAWYPARQAAATSPLTTLSRAHLEQQVQRQLPWLAAAGLALVVSGLLIAFVLPGGVVTGFVGLFIFLFGAVFITPLALPAVYRLLSLFALSGVARMVVRDINRHVSRLGTASAALMVALAASVGVAVMVDSMRGSVSDWLQSYLNADLYIAPVGFEDGAFLPLGVDKHALALNGVDQASLYRDQDLLMGGRKIELKAAALAPRSRAGFILVDQVDDPWAAFDRGSVLVSEPLARRLRLKPGGEIELPTPAGQRRFEVAAIFRDYASEHGRVFLQLQRFQAMWQDQRLHSIALFSSGGDVASLYRQASEAMPGQYALVLTVADEIYRASMTVFDRTFRITEVLRILSVSVAFIGMLTALMAVLLERRKEFAVLRALGLTRQQLSGLILAESLLLGVIAALAAIPTGLVLAWVLVDAIQPRAFGWTMPFELAWLQLLWTLILGAGAALLAGLYPAWTASRASPAPQLRED